MPYSAGDCDRLGSGCSFGFLFITITLLYAAEGAGTMNGEALACAEDPAPFIVDVGSGWGAGCERWCMRTLLLHSGTWTRITAVAMAVGFESLFRSYFCKFKGAIEDVAIEEVAEDEGATMSTELALANTPDDEVADGLYELSGDINIVLSGWVCVLSLPLLT